MTIIYDPWKVVRCCRLLLSSALDVPSSVGGLWTTGVSIESHLASIFAKQQQ